jgi:outer membrane protein
MSRKTGFNSAALLLPALVCAGCAMAPPRVAGVAGTAPSADVPWTPPAEQLASAAPAQPDTLDQDAVSRRLAGLTLAGIVDIALANSPDTRAAWAEAKAAAAAYGAARGDYFPQVDATVGLARGNGSGGDWSTTYGPGVSLSWRLLDFGGRGGRVEAAQQTLLAADWTHNAVIQDAIFTVESAFYRYAGAKAILEANRASFAEAESSVVAAETRHDVGLATIADVLQARTARAQAQLDLLATVGQVRITRGALAVSMGYPANVPYDVEIAVPAIPVAGIAQEVETLIARAVAARPDLRAAQARAQAATARVRTARSDLLPSLSLGASAGRTWTDGQDGYEDRSGGSLVVNLPLFGGFSGRHDLARAQAEADAAGERARALRQQVVYEIFVAHSDFLTADERVRAVAELLASATRSEEVARGRYREGVGSILDLLSAQRALAEARAQDVNARLGWFIALAQLARDAGVLGLHGDNPLAQGNPHPEVER